MRHPPQRVSLRVPLLGLVPFFEGPGSRSLETPDPQNALFVYYLLEGIEVKFMSPLLAICSEAARCSMTSPTT